MKIGLGSGKSWSLEKGWHVYIFTSRVRFGLCCLVSISCRLSHTSFNRWVVHLGLSRPTAYIRLPFGATNCLSPSPLEAWLAPWNHGIVAATMSRPLPCLTKSNRAFLGVLMTSLPPETHWFMQGWPQHVVAGAYNFLSPGYRHWIHWHAELVGWTPGTPTTP